MISAAAGEREAYSAQSSLRTLPMYSLSAMPSDMRMYSSSLSAPWRYVHLVHIDLMEMKAVAGGTSEEDTDQGEIDHAREHLTAKVHSWQIS